MDRSDFCTKCFDQYCYNAGSPPSASEIVGRKLDFVDPDPQGVSRVENFLSKNKVPLIASLASVTGAVIVSIFVMYVAIYTLSFDSKRVLTTFSRRWLRKRREAKYQALNEQEFWALNDQDPYDPFEETKK